MVALCVSVRCPMSRRPRPRQMQLPVQFVEQRLRAPRLNGVRSWAGRDEWSPPPGARLGPKQLNGREFITGPRYRIAGITAQAGVGFGTQAAGLKLDRRSRTYSRWHNPGVEPREREGVYFILRFDRLTPRHGFRSRIVGPRQYPRLFWSPPGILGRRCNTRSAHQKTCTSR
jgi:hypothetical protein